MIRISKGGTPTGVLLATACITFLFQLQGAELPRNIGGNLRRLVEAKARTSSEVDLNSVHLALNAATNRYELLPGSPNFMADANNRVLVRVVLDGSLPVEQVADAIAKLQGNVTGTSTFARGLLSAYIPLEQSGAVAQLAGVRAVHLSLRPKTNVGLVTSQGVVALRDNAALAMGYSGKGITVGVLSDSYNTSGSKDTALDDVKSGDLPDTTAIKGGEGLKALIQDQPNGTDEGRGMAQIVHDMAPGAALCFATADGGEIDFANNMVKLADPAGKCNADILVDDVSYIDEPFFSDGLISDTIDKVSKTKKPDGTRAVFFSAAGNYQGSVYASDFRSVSKAIAAKQPDNPVDLSTIPSTIDVGGGLQNFASDGTVVVAQSLLVIGNPVISFQWDDPFDVGEVTTDYQLLLFDQNGKFIQPSDTLSNASSADNTFLTDEPIQAIAFDTSSTSGVAQYYLVIARTSEGSKLAHRLKYVVFDGQIIAPYFGNNHTPAVFGHPAAAQDISVAAYDVNRPPYAADPPYVPETETFTSPGPFLNAFYKDGTRRADPVYRSKPDIACVDGVFTTFFGQAFLSTDSFPRFFGTSAAAPCAAGIAALMLEKVRRPGGPRVIDPLEIRDIMNYSGPNHDLDAFHSKGESQFEGAGKLTIRIRGNNNNIQDPTNFRVEVKNAGTWSLSRLTLHTQPVNDLVFFSSATYPFTVGPTSPGVSVRLVNLIPPAGSHTGRGPDVTLAFTGLSSGKFAEFDVDRANAIPGYLDDDADRLGGATFEAEFTNDQGKRAIYTGPIDNRIGKDWAPFDGFGLIDAESAVAATP